MYIRDILPQIYKLFVPKVKFYVTMHVNFKPNIPNF